jgi:hypothetical protein
VTYRHVEAGAFTATTESCRRCLACPTWCSRRRRRPSWMPPASPTLRCAGFTPIGVDLSELLKAGGGAKCCALELRDNVPNDPSTEETAVIKTG